MTTKNHKRARAEDGDVVRVDVNGVSPDVIGGERDGIGRDDEISVADVDDGRVLANLRANQEARIAPGNIAKQRSQVLDWQFADWKNLFRLTASHVYT